MLLESLGRIVRLGSIEFKATEGYEFPVAEVDDSRAGTILKGESEKIKRGIPPTMRTAIPYTPKRVIPNVDTVRVTPTKRGRKPAKAKR